MPVKIVFDGPRRGVRHVVQQRLATVAAGALLVIGLVATVPAIPATFLVVGFVASAVTTSEHDAEPWPPEDFPLRLTMATWAVSTSAAVVGLRGGLRLLRSNRRSVLFLRRFGYDDATEVVSFVVEGRMGSAWRVVTLDDAEIVPIGVASTTRRFVRAGTGAWSLLLRGAQLIGYRGFPLAIFAMIGIIAIQVLIATDRHLLLEDGTADAYLGVFTSIMQLDPPFDAVALTLPGMFAAAGIVAMATFLVLGATFVALLAAFPLAGIVFFVSFSTEAVQRAELEKTARIETEHDLWRAITAVNQTERSVFAPRLLVLRVATRHWQETVKRLAAEVSVILVDISEPTENLAWELEALTGPTGPDCVLVGQLDRVSRFASAEGALGDGPLAARLRSVLEGQEVLAYTTDRSGMRRFARALEGRLLAPPK